MSRLITAYHEAGHAVASWNQGLQTLRISIVSDLAILGRTRFGHVSTRGGDHEARIRMTFAGPIAQRRLAPDSSEEDGWEDRTAAAHLMSELLCPGGETRARLQARLWSEAVTLIDESWPVITALARELIVVEEMDGAALRWFMCSQSPTGS